MKSWDDFFSDLDSPRLTPAIMRQSAEAQRARDQRRAQRQLYLWRAVAVLSLISSVAVIVSYLRG